MLLSSTRTFPIPHCHGGAGEVICREIMGEYEKSETGFKFIHDNLIPSGASIGEHEHCGDEEVYFIVSGEGEMVIDGERCRVGPGDVCLTRHGHRHSLTNTGSGPMRLIVMATNVVTADTEAETASDL